MSEPVRLYTARDVARLLGVTSQALSNRRVRQSPRSWTPPEPTYTYGKTRAPLWTREQLDQMLADEAAERAARLEEL